MTSERKKYILLVEDDEVISHLLEHRLLKSGFEVKTVDNGKSAVEAAKERRPDLVLLDIVLPQMDGFGVLRELQDLKLTPDLPVIVISNSGQPVEIDRIMQLGARDYLVKVNFSPQEVLDKVKKVLES